MPRLWGQRTLAVPCLPAHEPQTSLHLISPQETVLNFEGAEILNIFVLLPDMTLEVNIMQLTWTIALPGSAIHRILQEAKYWWICSFSTASSDPEG